MELAWVADQQERSDEAMVVLQRAETTLENLLVHDPPRIDVIVSINQSRRRIASLLSRSALEGPRRRLMESHVRMLERLSERAGADPAIGLLATLVRLGLAPDDGATTKLRTAIRKLPANKRLPAGLDWEVACWIVSDSNPYPSGPNSTDESNGRLDPLPTPMRSSGGSNQDARRLATAPPCSPPRPFMWPVLPRIGAPSNERRVAWMMPAIPPQVSPPSRRLWYEELPTKQRSI